MSFRRVFFLAPPRHLSVLLPRTRRYHFHCTQGHFVRVIFIASLPRKSVIFCSMPTPSADVCCVAANGGNATSRFAFPIETDRMGSARTFALVRPNMHHFPTAAAAAAFKWPGENTEKENATENDASYQNSICSMRHQTRSKLGRDSSQGKVINYFSRCISTISIVPDCAQRVSIEPRRERRRGREHQMARVLITVSPTHRADLFVFYQETDKREQTYCLPVPARSSGALAVRRFGCDSLVSRRRQIDFRNE